MDKFIEQIEYMATILANYGPYALAALFLLYLAPKYTRRFIDYQNQNKKKQNFLLTIAVGNWLVALVMCFYIYDNWSPLTTFQGELGKHSTRSTFVTIDPDSFIASKDATNDRINWQFAFISQNKQIKDNASFNFTHVYKDEFSDDDFHDYQIPVSELRKNDIKISPNPDNPALLMISYGEQPAVKLEPVASYLPLPHKQQFWAAYAISAADSNRIIRNLSSSNLRSQVIGKRQLRSLMTPELRQLLQTHNISAQARRHIESTLRRR